MAEFHLRIEKVRAPSPVAVGATIPLAAGAELVMGRDPDADVFLPDSAVSRRHARLSVEESRVWIEPLDGRTVFVNKVAIEARTVLEPEDWIQLGGVLARLYPGATETRSAVPAMSIVTKTAAVVLRIDLEQGRAVLFGSELKLRPAPLLALAAVAEGASSWVSAERVCERIWPDEPGNVAYVNKNISYVRQAIRRVAASPGAGGELAAAIQRNADSWTTAELDGDAMALAREFLKARKKVGFRLHLSPGEVDVR